MLGPSGPPGLTCYDMFMTVAPGMLLTMAIILFQFSDGGGLPDSAALCARRVMELCLEFLSSAVVGFYLGLLLYGLITTVVEWQKIGMPSWKNAAVCLDIPCVYDDLCAHLSGRTGVQSGVEAHLSPRREKAAPAKLRAEYRYKTRTERKHQLAASAPLFLVQAAGRSRKDDLRTGIRRRPVCLDGPVKIDILLINS